MKLINRDWDNGDRGWFVWSGESPTLEAFDDGKGNYYVFCQYCGYFHHHGNLDGHRVAHCTSPASPYHKTGYNLKYAGRKVSKTIRKIDRIGQSIHFPLTHKSRGGVAKNREDALKKMWSIIEEETVASNAYIRELCKALAFSSGYRWAKDGVQ